MTELTLLFAYLGCMKYQNLTLSVKSFDQLDALGQLNYFSEAYFLFVIFRDSNFYACLIMAKSELNSVLNYHLVAFVIDSVTFLGVTSYIMTREHLRLTKELAEAGDVIEPIEAESAFKLLIYPLTMVSSSFGEERYELLRSGAVLCMNLLS